MDKPYFSQAIIGMPDQPISINGTVDQAGSAVTIRLNSCRPQVVMAVSGVNSVLQDRKSARSNVFFPETGALGQNEPPLHLSENHASVVIFAR